VSAVDEMVSQVTTVAMNEPPPPSAWLSKPPEMESAARSTQPSPSVVPLPAKRSRNRVPATQPARLEKTACRRRSPSTRLPYG